MKKPPFSAVDISFSGSFATWLLSIDKPPSLLKNSIAGLYEEENQLKLSFILIHGVFLPDNLSVSA
jgi:hypothetical protein